MTIHIHYDHKCPKCGAEYIPYKDKEKVPCPKCGFVEEQDFDFIEQAVNAIRSYLDAYGSIIPPGYAIMTLADHILFIIMKVLQAYKDSNDKNNDIEKFVKNKLDKVIWGNQYYLKDYIYTLTLKIYDKLDICKGNKEKNKKF